MRIWATFLSSLFLMLIFLPAGIHLGLAVILGIFFGKIYAMIWVRLANRQRKTQIFYFKVLFLVLGYMCKVDGHISSKEIETMEDIFKELELTSGQRTLAIQFFKQGQAADFDLVKNLNKLKEICQAQPGLLRLFIETQFMAAKIDGVTPEQQELLNTICTTLGFKPTYYNYQKGRAGSHKPGDEFRGRWEDTKGGGQSGAYNTELPNNEESDYALLEVHPSVNKDELKRAYRKLMSQHHPDKLIAKGLPENMIKLATKKTQDIQAAYERVKRVKGY